MPDYNIQTTQMTPNGISWYEAQYRTRMLADLFSLTRKWPDGFNSHWHLRANRGQRKKDLCFDLVRSSLLAPLIVNRLNSDYGYTVSEADKMVYKNCLYNYGYDGVILDWDNTFAVFFVEQTMHTDILGEANVEDYWLEQVDDIVEGCRLLGDSGHLFYNTHAWGSAYAFNLEFNTSWWVNSGKVNTFGHHSLTIEKSVFLLHSALAAASELGNEIK